MNRRTRPAAPPFRALVEGALAQVPAGRVTTYGDIARALGDVRAARAVGEVLSTNSSPAHAPCHRVVMVDGALGGYAFGGPPAKAMRLRREGIVVRSGRVAALESFVIRSFDIPPVFETLAKRQLRLAKRVSIGPCSPPPEIAIGVDASYTGADGPAFAAACAVRIDTGAEVADAVATFEPPVPYVPGYLAFRELPGLVAAVRKLPAIARRRAVLLVDGQGILHPRRCGIASMAGLDLEMPAVGVAKSRLVGRVGSRATRFGDFVGRKVSVEGEPRGYELTPASEGAAHSALFVSPGTGISPRQSARLAAALTKPGAKSPRPVELADVLSRRVRAQRA